MVSNIVGAANISNYSMARHGPSLRAGPHSAASRVISFWLSAGPSCSMLAMVVALL
jgi:hypothetical protein